MQAVILTGGKQYRVAEGDTLRVETLDAEVGGKVAFEKVLLVSSENGVKVGAPYLDGVAVNAEVVQHGRGKKITIIKFKRRKHHDKKQGHRQNFTEVKITDIKG